MKYHAILVLAAAVTAQDWMPRTPDETLAIALHSEAVRLFAEGRFQEAERKSLRSISLLENSFGANEPVLAAPLLNLAAIYFNFNKTALSEQTLTRVQTLLHALPPDSEIAARTYQTLAAVELRKGDERKALALDRKALSMLESRLGPGHLETLIQRANVGLSLARIGRAGEAIPELESTLAAIEAARGSQDPLLLNVLNALLAANFRNPSKAIVYAERSIAIAQAAHGPDAEIYGVLLAHYSNLLRRLGRKSEAKTADNRSREILAAHRRYSVDVKELLLRPNRVR